ncbi:MAG: aromatic ring-hydroxylating dioxygenase subunit alpha, partial [Chloroflexota bacterium]
GIPEAEGLRCPYHGWLFNHEGRCLEQPAEPWNSTFKERMSTTAYRVEALAGLVFAYLGPEPAPLLPRYDLLVWDDAIRHIGVTDLPCNYLQCVENGLDPTHAQWLHGYYLRYVWGRRGRTVPTPVVAGRHVKIGFDRFEHGIVTRRVIESSTEEHEMWRVGGSVIFPVIRRVGSGMQWRVPVDDTHTRHYTFSVFRHGGAGPRQERVPVYEIPLLKEDGRYNIDVVIAQDFMAWASQGPVAEREQEHLGQADIGIILYRELLTEQLERVERGEEPIGVIRDPAANVCISLPDVNSPRTAGDMFTQAEDTPASDFHLSPLRDSVLALREELRARRA